MTVKPSERSAGFLVIRAARYGGGQGEDASSQPVTMRLVIDRSDTENHTDTSTIPQTARRLTFSGGGADQDQPTNRKRLREGRKTAGSGERDLGVCVSVLMYVGTTSGIDRDGCSAVLLKAARDIDNNATLPLVASTDNRSIRPEGCQRHGRSNGPNRGLRVRLLLCVDC